MQYHLQFETSDEIVAAEDNFVEYKIIISPAEKIINAVKSFKSLLAEQCGPYKSFDSIPHITLATFRLDNGREQLLVKCLDKFTSSQTPFRIAVNDFSFSDAIKNDGVASMGIQNKDSINQLQAYLNVMLKIDVRVQKKYVLKLNTPRITIAKNLSKDKLDIAKSLLDTMTFTGDFSVDKLVLLKRRDDNVTEVVKEFYFF